LLGEALQHVPPGPTRLRARLLARSAIVQSHHQPATECEALATKALAIARAIQEPAVTAGALHALCVVVWDPARRAQHGRWTDELLALAATRPQEPWGRWVRTIVARRRATSGDIAGAADLLDELAVDASLCDDRGSAFDASYGPILRATVAGHWTEARAAARAVRAAAEDALIEPAGGAILEAGMFGIIDLLVGPAKVVPVPLIEWPMPSMELSVKAWHADCLARSGQGDAAATALSEIAPSLIEDVDHDAYWLPTLAMLADAAHLVRHAPTAATVWEYLHSLVDLTIVDPGLIYRGSAAHAAGLAAAACGRTRDARELLMIGLARHEVHGSPWMVERSREALATLATA
jgi:hypothetical protein